MLQQQSMTGCVGLGQENRAAGALGMDLETSTFHLLLFHTKVVEVFPPGPFVVPLCLEKYTGFMEGASKSHSPHLLYLSLPPSTASQGKSVSKFTTKIFWLYCSPWFYYSSVVVTKGVAAGDLLNWAGKKKRKPVRKKNESSLTEWRRSSTPSTSAEWKPNRRQQIPGLSRACLETGKPLKPTFYLPYFISKSWVLTTTTLTFPFPFYFF